MRYSAAVLILLSAAAAPGAAQTQGATKSPAAKPTATRTAPSKSVPVKKPLARPAPRTTLSGVYTLVEAKAGRDMYAGFCASCHTAASHTGPMFRTKWAGRPLAELFSYMRTMMPKNDPASLADEDYGVLLSYMLQMNQMPAGKSPLSTDSTELAKIRIDTARTIKKK